MKIAKFRSNCKKVKFISINEIMDVDISEGEGPEFELADGSILIFESFNQHYEFIINSNLFNIIDYKNKEIIDEEFKKLEEVRDDVQGVKYRNNNVIEAISYKFDNGVITRLILQKV